MATQDQYDVIVVGAGNAALSAATAAAELGARVIALEKAPEHLRGGNTYFTGGTLRFPFSGIEDVKDLMPDLSEEEEAGVDVGEYSQEKFYSDLMRVTEGLTDPELANILVTQANPTMKWLGRNGIKWVLMYRRQAFKIGDKYRFWGGLILEASGGGKGLADQQFEIAKAKSVEIRYEAKVASLHEDNTGRVIGVRIKGPEGYYDLYGKTVVLASGGFQANTEMRTRYLGADWELAKVRGTQFDTGDGIRMAMDIGAAPHGHWSSCHAVAWDLNAPPYGDRRLTDLFQKHSYPFGIVVNMEGERFVDEGADFRNYTYAKYGREIMKQSSRAAVQIFDAKVMELLRDEYFIPEVTSAQADTIEELAKRLDIDPAGLVKTVEEFNASVSGEEYNPTILDGKHTQGIEPPKSNWALPIDKPPYVGYSVTCGVTFTFGGLRINNKGQVQDTEETSIPGLYAAGELVGGLFYYNYPGGSGLMAGAVFGKLAGTEAAGEALA
ncbi:MAG: tricarballylate dehydrogenase [Chloroflexi bacterium]|nr:MAG: tricarballylate dehydrogenase [Chloroflexota bacterium]